MVEPKLDLQKLQALMMELALEALNPALTKLEKKIIDFEISEKLLNVFTYLAESQNIPVDKLLGQAASTGLKSYLSSITGTIVQNPAVIGNLPQTTPNKNEPSIEDMSQKMGRLKDILGQLNEFSEILNGLGSNK